MPGAFAQLSLKGSMEPYGRLPRFGTTLMCSSESQLVYNDVFWTERMEHSIVRGGPLNQCYPLGTVHGKDVGKKPYAGPKPPGFDAMCDEWMNDAMAFERVSLAIFGSHYAICFLCQSYGEQWNQKGAPGYRTDMSGPVELFYRTSTMPTDHYFRYDLTNNHYDRRGARRSLSMIGMKLVSRTG